jgi:starch-binding outer membrane protein, SusD/RagB family
MEITMQKWTRGALCALLVGSVIGCENFLEGEGLTTDPNNPSVATRDQLLVGVQLVQFVFQSGDMARHAGMWVQQFAGVGNQTVSRDQYQLTEGDVQNWPDVFGGGGLLDIRAVQGEAEAEGDAAYAGVAKVWEGLVMGTAASIWGDVPYTQAVSGESKPVLDPQEEVYADVQAVLDEAIGDLAGSTASSALRATDMVYGGDLAAWIEAANTLKARFYIHWAQVQSTPEAAVACGGECAALALAAAQAGISSPDNDFRTHHTTAGAHENIWYQWEIERSAQLRAGRFFVELLKDRNDPRLTEYFEPTASGSVLGGAPATSASGLSWLSDERGASDFAQPIVTYQENQLIMAEANFRLGNEPDALENLNNARAVAGLDDLSGLSGDALFNEIMTEKYIALFQNIEAWNDYKRTCVLDEIGFEPVGNARVPGRLFYPDTERDTNPNIPDPSAQDQRNANDPAICTATVLGEA